MLFKATLAAAALLAYGVVVADDAPLSMRGLSRWKLSLPIDANGDGKADEITSLGGYSNPPWFHATPQGIVFRANAGGARTSGSTAYARSELREMDGPAAWDCLGASRSLSLEQRLLHTTTAKPEATLGQIHDAQNDNLMLKYVGPSGANGNTDTGRIELLWNNAQQSAPLDPAYTLGDAMRVRIAVEKGAVAVDYRNLRSGFEASAEARLDPAGIVGACYFKAGVYIQACSRIDSDGKPNTVCEKKGWDARRYDAPEAYAEVLIWRIEM